MQFHPVDNIIPILQTCNRDLQSLSNLPCGNDPNWSISAALPKLNFLQEFHSVHSWKIHLSGSLRKFHFPPICLDSLSHEELKQKRQENSVQVTYWQLWFLVSCSCPSAPPKTASGSGPPSASLGARMPRNWLAAPWWPGATSECVAHASPGSTHWTDFEREQTQFSSSSIWKLAPIVILAAGPACL